jgi:hypothetical protein
MEITESRFKPLFVNQILKDIKFYNIKEEFLALDEEKRWFVQGGVEFIFENNIVCLGWNAEMHLYEMIEGDLDQLLGDMDVYDIELDLYEEFEAIKGLKIEDASFNWSWYQKLDDELEPTDEKIYIPQEIKLKLENDNSLQIATVLFHLKANQLINPVYDPQGNLLIALNNTVEITENADLS